MFSGSKFVAIDEKLAAAKHRIINLRMVITLSLVLCSYCDSADCVPEFKKQLISIA